VEARKIDKFKQESIAKLTKNNPKHFCKYIKSKTSININVGEHKSMDSNWKEVWVTEDSNKAELLADFYSRIFIVETDEGPFVDFNSDTECAEITITLQMVVDKLTKLNPINHLDQICCTLG